MSLHSNPLEMAVDEPPPASPASEAKPATWIGDRVVALGLVSPDQLEVALFEQKRSGRMLGTVLVDLGFISHDVLASLLADASGYQRFDPKTALLDPDVLAKVSKSIAVRCRVVPLSIEGDSVFVAMCDPYDVLALDQLRRQLGAGLTVVPRISSPRALGELIDRAYGYAMSFDGIVKELETGEVDLDSLDKPDVAPRIRWWVSSTPSCWMRSRSAPPTSTSSPRCCSCGCATARTA